MSKYPWNSRLRLTGTRGAVGCTAIACMLAGAGTASAALPSPDSVRPGKNITVFHNIDFVAAFGHAAGEVVQVDVIRDGHHIATARGDAVETPEGGALEVNHGVEGTALPGDCWEGATPDVRPNDLIRVTTAGGFDEVIVDDLSIDSVTRVDPDGTPNPDGSQVWVQGVARSGLDRTTPIPVRNADGSLNLDSGEFRGDVGEEALRVEPNDVVDGLAPGTYIAKYHAPFNFVKGEGLAESDVLDALESDGHAFGFGHLPLPDGSLRPDAMLVEGLGVTNGPAVGCEASVAAPNSAGTVDVDALNAERLGGLADGDVALTVGGWGEAHLAEAELELRDEAGATVRVPVTGLDVDAGRQQGWSAEITKGQLAGLAQGELTAQMRVADAAGADTAAGVPKTVLYDTVRPTFSVTPEPGAYTGTQDVEVDGEGSISYDLDGAASRRYTEPIRLAPGRHTLVVRSRDEAGNVTTRTLEYDIKPSPAPAGAQPQSQPASGGTAAATPATPAPKKVLPAAASPAPAAKMVRRSTRISLAQARRRGLSAVFDAPSGARTALVRAYATVRGKRRLIGSKTVEVAAGRNTAVLKSRAIRRITPGRYTLQVVLRDATGKSGRSVSASVQVVR